MIQYDGDLQIPKHFLVDPLGIDRTFGEHLVGAGRRIYWTIVERIVWSQRLGWSHASASGAMLTPWEVVPTCMRS